MKNIKAWIVSEKGEFAQDVVFAETRGKAKSIAMYTPSCCETRFIDIRAKRFPKADYRYDGITSVMNWYNPGDRLFLVKEAGFYCNPILFDDCKDCIARYYCEKYKEEIKDI